MIELNDGGCPVLRDHGYKIRPAGLAIKSIPSLNFNRMFTLAHGGTGYYFDAVLRNENDHPITLWGFQINPFFARHKSLLPGDEIEGSLLASSDETIPAEIAHLAAISVTLAVFDSRRNEFSGQFGLRVHRPEVVAREQAELRAQAAVKQVSQVRGPVRSLVAPPSTGKLTEAVLREINRELLEFVTTSESKSTQTKS